MKASMRAGFTVMLVIAIALPGLVRAQSSTDAALTISLHPDRATVLLLPDEIEDAQIYHDGEFLVARVTDRLYVRPRPGTPAGVEGMLDVKTRTLRRTFKLCVVERAEEVRREIAVPAARVKRRARKAARKVQPVVPTVEREQGAGEATGEIRSVVPVAPVVPLVLPVVEPPPSAPSPATLQPHAGQEPAQQPGEPATERAAAAGLPGLALAVHALGSLGFTGLDVAGYGPRTARRSHRTLGIRLTGAPQGAWWALEAEVSGEWLAGPMVYFGKNGGTRFEVSGTLLRAEVGLRAQFGTKWLPSVYGGIGSQTHLRQTENPGTAEPPVETMMHGVVLALGMGLHYRASNVLLGLEFQARHGGPDDYQSISTLWTLGWFLDQGE